MVPNLEYLLDRQISRQWRGLLTALAEEFATQISEDELRQLMFRVGCRFATAHGLPPCASTADLAHALNARWEEADWGYVELTDEPEYLRIAHSFAPLHAFGFASLGWTPAFLQGAYQTWLSALGADGLAVAQASEFDENATLEFRLGRYPG
ncbi:cellulose biosynthesis protein BcsD [Paraburkholderia sp. DHOC27]|uniref:cellulose biosynthesis protein BcsD n=1 Tax=Paraburkholderia sp. DHOC27 TaxID=2303330 RepID=UPI000E3E4875|nr:cellulose biosynthesis protein BcsD [Paraburkholderia sp. DHOC27]RFU44916.1 cellulose synthase [Paraburkholderia sp. DHOC27]